MKPLLSSLRQLWPRGSVSLLPQIRPEGFVGKHRSATLNHAYHTKGDNTRATERYPMPNKKDLPHDIIEYLEEAEVTNGFLPNVFKVMANRPEEFRVFFAYHDIVMHRKTGKLSMADKELIALVVSTVNHTPYCVTVHSASHRKHSKKPTLADKLCPLSVSGNLWGRSQSVALNHPQSSEGENITKEIGRYPLPKKTDLPYDIVELMEEIEVKTGFLPNVFKAMAHRPAEFRAFFAYYNAIMNKEAGNLSKADKELIIVATSIVNKCPYCVIAHGALHRIYSKKPALADQVAVNWKLADLSDREMAMLDFALAVCRADNITEEHFQKLEAHGFDREDAWDIGSISAFFAMSNRLAHVIDLHPNPEFYIMGRIPREKNSISSQ
ncbi:uncharacterized protein [Erythrolamprus reginae]|uniref:uncharacterized protein n=1 Tax=Erythrolamprus reginae TaxID=121349 RepID=UPI00396C310A